MKDPEFVLHEKAAWYKSPHFSLIVPVADDPFLFEQLVTDQLTPNRFRLLCIPLFLYGVSLGDVIEGDLSVERSGRTFRVVERSGRSTFRVLFPQEPLNDHLTLVRECLLEVERLGGLFERYHNGYWSIDAVDEETARNIEAFLATGDEAGNWHYEVGHRSWEDNPDQPAILRGPDTQTSGG